MSELREKLMYKPKNGYDRLSPAEEQAMEAYCADYRKFLDNGKTHLGGTAAVVAYAPKQKSVFSVGIEVITVT